jgi:DinB superfamily
MHSHLEDVFSRLDQARGALHQAVDAVPPAARRTRPAPDRWSTAEVLEHLSMVERLFTDRIANELQPRITGLARETAERAKLPDVIETRMADRVNRRQAPDTARPTGEIACDDAWARLEEGHDRLRTIVGAADGLALGQVMLEHRFFGTLTIYQWIELMAAHEGRHTQQIREIATALAV